MGESITRELNVLIHFEPGRITTYQQYYTMQESIQSYLQGWLENAVENLTLRISNYHEKGMVMVSSLVALAALASSQYSVLRSTGYQGRTEKHCLPLPPANNCGYLSGWCYCLDASSDLERSELNQRSGH